MRVAPRVVSALLCIVVVAAWRADGRRRATGDDERQREIAGCSRLGGRRLAVGILRVACCCDSRREAATRRVVSLACTLPPRLVVVCRHPHWPTVNLMSRCRHMLMCETCETPTSLMTLTAARLATRDDCRRVDSSDDRDRLHTTAVRVQLQARRQGGGGEAAATRRGAAACKLWRRPTATSNDDARMQSRRRRPRAMRCVRRRALDAAVGVFPQSWFCCCRAAAVAASTCLA